MGDRRCCCGPICLIQSNDLDSDADLDNNFTLSDGTKFSYHAYPFDAIQISNASETATADTAHPQSPYPPRVQIKFYGDNIGSQIRVILGEKIIAQVTVGDNCSELDLLDSSETELTDTLIMPYVDRNEWHRLTVCYDPDTGIVKATVYDLTQDLTYNLDASYSGDALTAYAAFGTGPTHVDNVYVRNFRFWRLWYCGNGTEDCPDSDGYYDPPERQYCYTCEPSCEIVNAVFSRYPDGDMPCDWDAGSTDWEIISGAATGTGSVCHTFDASGGGYTAYGVFGIGALASVGDSTSVSLSNGTVSIGLTVTREATRYRLDWTPSTIDTSYTTAILDAAYLKICQNVVCGLVADITGTEITSVLTRATGTPGQICMSASPDSRVASISIGKSKSLDPDCPECECVTVCETYCVDSIWPSAWFVEIDGVANGCCDIDGINRGFYSDEVVDQCWSKGYGDDGEGSPYSGCTMPTPCLFSASPKPWSCTSGPLPSISCTPGGSWVVWIYVIGANSEQDWLDCAFPVDLGYRDGNVVRVDVRLMGKTQALIEWGIAAANPSTTHLIVVRIHRVFGRYGQRGIEPTRYTIQIATITYVKEYSSVTDCKNLTDELIPYIGEDSYLGSLSTPVWNPSGSHVRITAL